MRTVVFLATVVSLGLDVIREQNRFAVTYARDQFLTAAVSGGESGVGADGAPRSGAETLRRLPNG